ncbi:MAG: hypothetical protein LH606_22350 [Cytophagaceae bacterium]|nr:hypothetical protein [Cytophagaceae bacterium]
MNSSSKNSNHNSRSEQVATIFAAFLGLGVTAWVITVLGVKQGDSATAAYFLIGIPTYKLGVIGFHLVNAFRLRLIQMEPRHQRVYRTLLPRLAALVAVIGKVGNTP